MFWNWTDHGIFSCLASIFFLPNTSEVKCSFKNLEKHSQLNIAKSKCVNCEKKTSAPRCFSVIFAKWKLMVSLKLSFQLRIWSFLSHTSKSSRNPMESSRHDQWNNKGWRLGIHAMKPPMKSHGNRHFFSHKGCPHLCFLTSVLIDLDTTRTRMCVPGD